ncbi:hypothetical protein THRCLA_04250 [Thraustotheca clavata]|uniref:protein O-GlcNAc transferase n=1 Tax=Thraustotheca clavata TaxID=74557 RepID=A0A1V9ZZK5_9STRA|nr:hypothetical protein THRCLA_04250 [Thraustotheca clavata]
MGFDIFKADMVRWLIYLVLAVCGSYNSIDYHVSTALNDLNLGDISQAKLEMALIPPAISNHPGVDMVFGAIAQVERNWEQAILHYERSLAINNQNDGVHANLGATYFSKGNYVKAIYHAEVAIEQNQYRLVELAHSLALSYHYTGENTKAKYYYQIALNHAPLNAHLHYDYAVTLQAEGEAIQANSEYNTAIALKPNFPHAWLNIAALHLQHANLDSALRNFEKTLSLQPLPFNIWLYATINYGAALELTGDVVAGVKQFERAHLMLELKNDSTSVEYLGICEHKLRAWKSVAYWKDFEQIWIVLLAKSIKYQVKEGLPSSMTPFASLALPMPPSAKRLIAESMAQRRKRLSVGYLSHDFNNHPTAHLMEGLFERHNRSRIEVSIFSYAKDDNSSYYTRLPQLAEYFIDLVRVGNNQAAQIIYNSQVDILVDAQGHTLGHRFEIVAKRPAPIIVNYLVYPGTLGTKYVDYLVADANHSFRLDHYVEKLMYLPYSYQVNHYPKAVKLLYRKQAHQPFIFANYNKIDKLEPTIFGAWMRILIQVPNSELWLITSVNTKLMKIIKHNIYQEASTRGILSSRIKFLPRKPKIEHLERQQQANLFLDTLVYGAHSTATDALWGKLPVLTLAGPTFASRVGISLLNHVNCTELIVYSVKEYESIAVYLAKSPYILQQIVNKLDSNQQNAPLFHTSNYTSSLEQLYEMALDIYHYSSNQYHLIVPST